MATREQRPSTQYSTNGGAAYDMHSRRNAVGAAPAPDIRTPAQMPKERTAPKRERAVRVKVKTAVSPFALIGFTVACSMLVLVIFGYVQLYEVTTRAGQYKNEITTLNKQNQQLSSDYEGMIDLAVIEARAIEELGMTQPNMGQIRYIDLESSNKAVILQEEKIGMVSRVFDAIKTSILDLVAYLS